MQNISLLTAYLGGLAAFFSPCLIPLLPSYMSIITGYTFKDLYGLNFDKLRGRVFVSSLCFVMGFSIVFSLMGASSTIIGSFLLHNQFIFTRVGGLVLIFLGLIQVGLIRFEFLQFDYAWNIQRKLARLGYITAFITGATFAFIWIPCIGAVLGAILLVAAQAGSVYQGSLLLFAFSAGIGTPFLLLGLFFPALFSLFREKRAIFHYISVGAGVVMIMFGILLIMGYYKELLQWIAFITASYYRPE